MVGIMAYGAYVPYNRLDRKWIGEAFGKPVMAGEKAVANYDEDSVTMAVSAALDFRRYAVDTVLDAVYFATTTSPYKEKQCATVISAALDLPPNARTADFGGSLRCGASALLAGMDAAERGMSVLVAASDCRLGAADGPNEILFGDGAAAFILGDRDPIARIVGWYSVSADFHDQWRAQGDTFVRSWEERFALTQAYMQTMAAAAGGVMEKTGLKAGDFSRAVIYSHTPKHQAEISKKLGFRRDQLQDGLFESVGNAGAASAPLMLAAALEKAKPGDRILMLSYGEGSDAIVFEVTQTILAVPMPSVARIIAHKNSSMNYEKYLRWKQLLVTEPARRPRPARPSLPEYYRNPRKNFALYGSRCLQCGTPQFPGTRVCIRCQATDRMEPYRFYGRQGRIATYTADYLSDSPDPPNVVAVVDFEGGGRIFCNLVDCEPENVRIGMRVEMVFRRLFAVDGIHTYFWKAAALPAEGAE